MATPPAPPQKPACPRCGTAGGGVGGGPSPSQPSSQPDEAGQETAGGVVAACTSCGFIMDDTPLDGRPPPRRGEQEGGRGGGGGNGGVSGGGEGLFVSAHAGALTAAVAAAARTGAPSLRYAERGLAKSKDAPTFAALAEMAGIARTPSALPPARLLLRTALATPSLAGVGRTPHRLLAAAALLACARSDDPLTPASHIAGAAGVALASLVSAHHHLVCDLGLSHREERAAGGAPGEAERLGRALGGAVPCSPGVNPAAVRSAVVAEAMAMLAWAEGPGGPHPAKPLGSAALRAGVAALAASAHGLAYPLEAASAFFQVPPRAISRAVGSLKQALLGAAPAAPWLGPVKVRHVHLHLGTLVAAASAVAARKAAAGAAPRLAGCGDGGPPVLLSPVTPGTKRGGGGGRGGDGGPPPRPRTRARVADVEEGGPAAAAGTASDSGNDSLDDEDWAEYIRSPEEVAFVRAVMEGRASP